MARECDDYVKNKVAEIFSGKKRPPWHETTAVFGLILLGEQTIVQQRE